ncbi:response regulator [Paenibacillus sp. JCM 10914]|uniref:response regulator n=1 Tax=Paenibacillus sp. JCM 10914 TaxID=1236974 RepID=UPI0003CC5853|nr:response regulator [Paenibacillus sp. JCM 10914]GAE04924.1 multi-sensor hybrid histidine kinase [Paenibacillus sp. JCM 10914]
MGGFEQEELRLLEDMTILVVDDDIRNVYGLMNGLEKLNLTVHTARNGYECLELLEKLHSIDAVLLDMNMPEMDGCETIKRIREHPDWNRLPVMVMASPAWIRQGQVQHMDDEATGYVQKPVQISEVISKLLTLL